MRNFTRLGRVARSHPVTARFVGEVQVQRMRRSGLCFDLILMASHSLANSVVFDVGASVGNYSLAAARRVGRLGLVVAMEPNPVVYGELVHSVWGSRVIPLNLAASDDNGWRRLCVPIEKRGAETQLGSLEPRLGAKTVDQVRVRAIRLDSLASGALPTSVIKVDVEGHELSVLRGAEEILQVDHPVLIVEIEARHLVGTDVDTVVEWIVDKGYDAYGIGIARLIPWDEFDVAEYQTRWLESCGSGTRIKAGAPYVNNFIFTPKDRKVEG